MTPHVTPRRDDAFTLLELLVVVAIIAALLAILTPSMGRAKKFAEIAPCGSNLRQINLAFNMYFMESRFPDYPYPGNGNASFSHFWMGKIADRVSNLNQIRICPSAAADGGVVWGSARTLWNGKYHPPGYWIHRNEDLDKDGQSDYWLGSYAINGWMYNGYVAGESYERNYSSPGSGISLARAPTFIDSAWVDLWPRTYDPAAASYDDPRNGANWGGGMVRSTLDRHVMSVNVVFMDGHVENLPLGQLWWLQWSKLFQPGVGEPAI